MTQFCNASMGIILCMCPANERRCNIVSHWMGIYTKWSLHISCTKPSIYNLSVSFVPANGLPPGTWRVNSLSPGGCGFHFRWVIFKCISVITSMDISRAIVLLRIAQNRTDDCLYFFIPGRNNLQCMDINFSDPVEIAFNTWISMDKG